VKNVHTAVVMVRAILV